MIDPFVILTPILLLAVIALLRFVGCAALLDVQDVSYAAPAALPISVNLGPKSVTLSASDSQAFAAKVTNDPDNKGVDWDDAGGGGTFDPPQTVGGTTLVQYHARSSVPTPPPPSFRVTATSKADSSKSDSADVNLVPVTVTVSPKGACLGFSGTKQFAAMVPEPQNKAVTWNLIVSAPSGGDNLTPSGLYTAPNFVTKAETATVRAISQAQADGSKFDDSKVYLYPFPPCRPAGSVRDQSNLLFANLVGLFIMNEGVGTTDKNLVPGSPTPANFKGASLPSWNPLDPSIVFNGGGPGNSFLDTGPGLSGDAFDLLPTSKITIVAKVNANTSVAAGVCEKNDGNASGPSGFSGFLFGWDNTGALQLTVERANTNLRVATASGSVPNGQWVQVAFTWDGTVGTPGAAQAHLFVKGSEQTKAVAQDGLGAIGTNPLGATTNPFRIGTAGFDLPGSLNGRMAYVAIYKNRVLTPAELITLDGQLPITSPP